MAISITPSPFGSITVTLDGELGGVLQASILSTSNSALNMDLGVPGPQGEAGEPGANGVGVAAGGLTNQVLVKLSNDDFDTGWANGGSGGDYLPLTGGSMTGDIAFLVDGNGDDTAVGSFGLGTENTDGKVAYIEPTQIRIYDSTHLIGTSLNGTGITFNDETVQVTAGLPLTGGTITGNLNFISGDTVIIMNDPDGSQTQLSAYGLTLSGPITFGDNTQQFTAYDPAVLGNYLPLTGGTVSGSVTIDSGSNFTVTGGDGNILSTDYNANVVKIGLATIPVEISSDWIKTENSDGHMLFGRNYEGADNLGIRFANNTFQNTAWLGYNGTTSQYVRGDGSLYTFPPVGDRYLTSSTSTLTCDSGNGKTMTVGTGLSYSRQQDITVSYDTANHMHGTVLTYNSTTGVMTFDSNTHSGGGTYSSWEVNVGGVAGAILPVGGTAGQVLAKINSTNFNTEWISLGSMAQATTTDYLSKAGNLSGLASTTTARTNLGLGTASTLASSAVAQTANNLSDLASASTARTNLGLGTAATQSTATFLQTANNLSDVTASTARTNLGLTSIATSSFATTAEAQAGTSTTTVINPSTLFDAKFFAGGKFINAIAWSTATSGVGASASAQSMNGRVVSSPTSLSGYGQNLGTIVNNSRGGAYTAGIDWSKRVIFGGRFSRNVTTPDTAAVFRFSLGRFSGQAPSDISASDKQVGIKVSGSGAIVLYVANGSALTTTTSSFTPSNSSAYDVVIVSDGAGNVTLYVNGSSVATSTGGPTSSQGANYNVITFEAQNSTTLTNGSMVVIGSDFFAQVNS